jgi:mono/diheme cytochrome c family protein
MHRAARIVSVLIAVSAIRGGVPTRAQTRVEPPAPLTFNQHVAPIIFKYCSGCHRPGGGAPFDLLTYDDVRPRATQIAMATKSRRMPPWKPEPGFGDFEGVRRLSDGDVDVIQRWIAQGAVAGKGGITPRAPQWTTDWQLGTPDLVVAMPEPYLLTSDGLDVLRSFVLPIPLTVSRYVTGIEFRPGNSSAVHHANLKIDRTGSSKRLDQRERVLR